jgi:hypothetical protein
MRKRGLLWIALGTIMWIAATFVGYSRVYWWEMPLYIGGFLMYVYGLVRMEGGEAGNV